MDQHEGEKLPGNHRNRTVQYIWMACDCLGPCGDDRFGCRDAWEAYCMMKNKKSTVTSFQENRFNNLFQAAASLHYHRADIQDCLSSFMSRRNQKLESILQEGENETIDCHLIALGLIYFWITGPYWSLLGTSLHYLAFYQHVERLRSILQRWQQDASSALEDDWFCIFDNIRFVFNVNIFQCLRTIPAEKKKEVTGLLQNMCAGFISVTDHQLTDFLPGGRYNNIEDPDLWEQMKHSSLTNLVGEECFRDLDFSLFKRRHASIHHHSTVNMLKRNKSVSDWLSLKSLADQKELLQLSAQKSSALRNKHRQQEKDAVLRKRDMLILAQQNKVRAEETQRTKTQEIMRTLRPHQGPCETVDDITRLIGTYSTNKTMKAALKAEIQFQKLVLHGKSPLLKVTGSLLMLLNNLRQYLGGEPLQQLPPLQRAASHQQK